MAEVTKEHYGPWALIAGGSEGIGLAFARRLAAAGIHLVLLARSEDKLQSAADALIGEYPVSIRTEALDLAAPGLEAKISSLADELEIGLLIYNAGAVHGAALFLDRPLVDACELVALNCHGPLTCCHILGNAMRERGRGGMILLSSMSGLGGGAYTAVYGATKSFDIVLAEALWMELQGAGVDVLGLICGATDTPAMARSGVRLGEETGFVPMSPENVAEEGLAALGAGPLHVAGEGNREMAEVLRGDRKQAIEFLSIGAAMLFDKPWPPQQR